jgi:hypothetical protein
VTGREIERKPDAAPPTLFGSNKPAEIVKVAGEQAEALKAIIEKNRLYADISGKKHVMVQGWTFLGSMVGVHPVTVWTRRLRQEEDGVDGWEARVEARTRAGETVGAAEAMCCRDENRWEDADEYAMRSMAQTRATSKALRQPLDFIMQLAGFEATPAEEIPTGGFRDRSGPKCPACGSKVWDNNEAVDREIAEKGDSNKPRWRCSNKGCQGGSNGRGWASWEKDPFSVSPEAASSAEGDEVLEAIFTAMNDGAFTKAKLISSARRIAKDEGEPQPTEPQHLINLTPATRILVAEALGVEVIQDAEVVTQEPAGHCQSHDTFTEGCGACDWERDARERWLEREAGPDHESPYA